MRNHLDFTLLLARSTHLLVLGPESSVCLNPFKNSVSILLCQPVNTRGVTAGLGGKICFSLILPSNNFQEPTTIKNEGYYSWYFIQIQNIACFPPLFVSFVSTLRLSKKQRKANHSIHIGRTHPSTKPMFKC